MKKLFIICLCACTFLCKVNILQAQSVGIGTTTPNPSAALDVSSSNKGFLPPRMSSTQRTAIPNPRKGLMVYDTTQNEHVYFDGGKWRSFYAQNYDSAVVDYSSTASAGLNMLLAGNNTASGNAGYIYDNGGSVGNYLPSSNSQLSIFFDDTTLGIKVNIEEMNLELFYDSLYILQRVGGNFNYFDTIVKISGTQIGNFVFTNSIKFVFKSNNINNLTGFKIKWGRLTKGSIAPIEAPLFGWHIDSKKNAAMGGQQRNNYWHTDSVGRGSFGYGLGNYAKGNYSVVMGINNIALGDFSVAMGSNTLALSDFSVAIGFKTAATGDGSIAMGDRTKAYGFYSSAFGSSTKALGTSSTALGSFTTASGSNSTAMGRLTIAKGYASTVIGIYNDSLLTTDEVNPSPNTPLFLIGNGDDNSTRSNAMVVYKNGDVDINGNLKIDNGTSVWSSIPTGFAANRTTTLSVPPSTFTDVLFTTQTTDDGGDNYDPTTGEFTAPTAGMYRFETSVYWNAGIAGFENIYFYVNGVTRRFHSIVSANTSAHTLPFTASFKLTAGDIVKVVAYHINATAVGISANANGTYFTGVKVY